MTTDKSEQTAFLGSVQLLCLLNCAERGVEVSLQKRVPCFLA